MRLSVYIVWLSVLGWINLKLRGNKSSEKRFVYKRNSYFGLVLTGFGTTRPWGLLFESPGNFLGP